MVIWAAIALYAIVFLLVNDEKQSVSFVFFTVNTRLVWLILLSMALGAALAIIGPPLVAEPQALRRQGTSRARTRTPSAIRSGVS